MSNFVNPEQFEITIKPVDLEHVEERIQQRYVDFFYSLGYYDYKFAQVRDEILNILKTAMIYETEEETNPNRCIMCNKFKIRKFSPLLNTEVRALVFQDSENKIRYILSLYASQLESSFSEFQN